MKIRDKLGKERLYFDGGMGSLLIDRGLKGGELPETWNIMKYRKFMKHIFWRVPI